MLSRNGLFTPRFRSAYLSLVGRDYKTGNAPAWHPPSRFTSHALLVRVLDRVMNTRHVMFLLGKSPEHHLDSYHENWIDTPSMIFGLVKLRENDRMWCGPSKQQDVLRA
jgi:hypothetical protein